MDRGIDVLVQAHDKASGVFGRIGRASQSLTKALFSLKTAVVGLIATFGAYIGAKATVPAFTAQEDAIRGLRDAIEIAGASARDQLPDMLAYADHIQKVTKHSNDAALGLMDMAARITGATGPALRDVTTAVIGLSALLKTDLNTAFRLFKEASEGNTQVLKRYGIQINDALPAQERFNKLMELGAKSFKIAEREGDATSGTFARFRNVVQDLRAMLGEGLAPLLEKLADLFTRNRGKIEALIQRLAELKDKAIVALVKGFTMAEVAVRNWGTVTETVTNWFSKNWTNLFKGIVVVTVEAMKHVGDALMSPFDDWLLKMRGEWAESWLHIMSSLGMQGSREAVANLRAGVRGYERNAPRGRRQPFGDVFTQATGGLKGPQFPQAIIDQYQNLIQGRLHLLAAGKPGGAGLGNINELIGALAGAGGGIGRGVSGLRGRLLTGEAGQDPAVRTAKTAVEIRKLIEQSLDTEHELLGVTRDIAEDNRNRRILDLSGVS